VTTIDGPVLQIQSDLRLDVDGLRATVVADGQQLTVETVDAGRLLARAGDVAPTVFGSPLGAASLPAVLRRAGQLLDAAGLSARIVSDRGAVIELGHGCTSRAGRTLLGSDHVRLGRMDAFVPVLAEYARAMWVTPTRARSAVAGLVIAAVLVGSGRRRRADGRRR
jgi:hypothetical protein